MELAHRLLVDGGIFLYHSIGGNKSVHDIDPWIDKYIFPHAVLPSIAQADKGADLLRVAFVGVRFDELHGSDYIP
jgi:cyclopropane-fatty-acyl-phospholipid synthase